MFRKSFTTLFVVSILSILFVAGCSNNESSGNQGAEGEEEVTINFMHLWPAGSSPDHHRIVNEIIAEFEELHSNVTVELEVLENEQYKNQLQVISSSNQLPDVGMTWPAGFMEPYVRGERFASLDDILDDDFKNSFVAGTREAYEVNGTTYALPLELNIAPVFYNKAIFEENGVEVPETYEEFLEVVDTLVANGVTPIALGNRDRWTGSLWYMYLADRIGGDTALNSAIDRSGSFENESLIEAAAEIQNLVERNAFIRGFNGLSDQEAKSEFMNSNAAMYLIGSWDLPNYTTNEEVPQEFRDSIGFFKFPQVEGGAGDINSWVGGPGVGLFVSENSDVKEEAKAFVKYFVERWGNQAVVDAGVIPGTQVDTEAVDLPDLFIEVLEDLNNASNITLFADVQMSASVAETHLDLIQALFGNEVTPEDYAKQHEEALSQED
ncbi:raffinose/stachyose/melibiose transport system substrate-binding protein [Evansella vedderi]|uniref:Raffinose/stachyose/melibiose transport system substrate-binding protein n=1 Tax=Evansella vedderi TaxID=38282 RepID=A0ABT9ZXG4_9BACI|nr:extracellular solute-binding protein [Evansella vedderi]MDQ0255922.1 raffinose/stachyose/melibiose transport system substrate-binding protein [Evansella vedderi]